MKTQPKAVASQLKYVKNAEKHKDAKRRNQPFVKPRAAGRTIAHFRKPNGQRQQEVISAHR